MAQATSSRILVVPLSGSFADLWAKVARSASVSHELASATGPVAVSHGVAAVIVACGGVEADAGDWLDGHDIPAGVPVFCVGAEPGRRTAANLVGRGATDYFALPEDVELLMNAVSTSVDRRRESERHAERQSDRATADAFAQITGRSAVITRVLSRAERILPHRDATALIIGETGTGKELLARALHDGSPRRNAPFVAVNCSALPGNLVESELFGHERGAFTDAHAAKPGLFEMAEGGTLFLDELGTLSADVQAKLLRVLEDKEIRRVGGIKIRSVDARVIAATNEKLGNAVRDGAFREDLFFRLSTITLTLPPLRERGDDVVLIAEALLTQLAARHEVARPPLSAEAIQALKSYQWPGNVRELKNAVERALLLSRPGELDPRELVPDAPELTSGPSPIPFPAQLDVITGAAVRATVDFCAGNRSEAARRLGISRQRLRRLLDEERRTA